MRNYPLVSEDIMTADAQTQVRSSWSPTRKRTPTASAVHLHASASTRIGVEPNLTQAFTVFGFGSTVTGSVSSLGTAEGLGDSSS